MQVKVVYLGGSRVEAKCESESLELPDVATVATVADAVAGKHPSLAGLLGSVRWALNYEFAKSSDKLADGDEVALLPPVSGGSPSATLTEQPIDPSEVLARVAADSVGATVLFVGTVRNHSRGQSVDHLEYEVYGPMAERQLDRIATECGEQHGADVQIAHRHGHLAIGEVSIVIAAASAHRADAFDACRAAIERVKVDVPIWKREQAADGESWVGWGGG